MVDRQRKKVVVQLKDALNTVWDVESYQAGAAPYLGRTSTGWIAPACGWRTYSITSSSWASIVGGTVKPNAPKVLRFMASSIPVGCNRDRKALRTKPSLSQFSGPSKMHRLRLGELLCYLIGAIILSYW